jgi:hypothetical protein
MPTERVSTPQAPPPVAQAPQSLGLGAKVVIIFVALVLIGGVRELAGCGDSAEAEWTGTGRVCDFDGVCQEEFKCRSIDGIVEIYLPFGSFSSGNEGWQWEPPARIARRRNLPIASRPGPGPPSLLLGTRTKRVPSEGAIVAKSGKNSYRISRCNSIRTTLGHVRTGSRQFSR